ILWSVCCGLLVNKALLLAGVDWMLVRYPIDLLAAYGSFFVGVRLWLAYVGAAPLWSVRKAAARDGNGIDLGDWSGTGSVSSGPRVPALSGRGGDFGGGGASSSFGSSGTGGGIDLDLGDGDGWLVIVLLALAAALLCSVFGAVLYVVYSAPSMLADVAFSAMLAG